MKAIVTGGCGFIGYNITKNIKEMGWDVLVIDNLTCGYKSNYVDGVKYIYEDVQDEINNAIKSFNPDVIFHLAAIPRVAYSVEFPLLTTEKNVMMTVKLLDAVRLEKPNTRIVYSSSSSIYGGAAQLPTPETEPSNPKSPYAMQKWQGEEWNKIYAELYGLDIVSLRYFNVFGPFSRYGGAYSTVLSGWLYSLLVDTNEQAYLEGDGLQTRDFCYVDNAVQANILAAQRQESFHGESFNIAHGERHSLLQCKDIIEKITGNTLELEMRPPRQGDVDHTLADIRLAREHFGYDPIIDFENQLREMAKWYENYPPN